MITESHNTSLTVCEVGRYHGPCNQRVTYHVFRDAGVAQLVEQRFRKPQVARSIRVAGSIASKTTSIIHRAECEGISLALLNEKSGEIRRGCALFVGIVRGGWPLSRNR